jgi:hypothetical protein
VREKSIHIEWVHGALVYARVIVPRDQHRLVETKLAVDGERVTVVRVTDIVLNAFFDGERHLEKWRHQSFNMVMKLFFTEYFKFSDPARDAEVLTSIKNNLSVFDKVRRSLTKVLRTAYIPH